MVSVLKQTILVTFGSLHTLTVSLPQALEKMEGVAVLWCWGLLLTNCASLCPGSLSPNPNLGRGSIEPHSLHGWPYSKASESGSQVFRNILEAADRLKQVDPVHFPKDGSPYIAQEG